MKNPVSNGIINLQTYSRPHLLRNCLNSIYSMVNVELYQKVFLLQIGDKEVESLVYEFADKRTEVIEVDGSKRSPLQNMNFNRWTALERAFNVYGCDWVLSIEEDVEVAPETLLFIEQVLSDCRALPYFRGINLGSNLNAPELADTYSFQRFGVHGCGTVMTRETWKKVQRWRIKRTLNSFALDGALEGIVKTGFMVTPNVTLYLDNGWDSGTHTKGTGAEPHYQSIRESWSVRKSNYSPAFRNFQIQIPWRQDCLPYVKDENLRFKINAIRSRLAHTATYLFTRRMIRSIRKSLRTYLRT